MDARTYTMFESVAAAEGWTLATQVGVLLQYVARQDSHEAFADYLSEQCHTDDGEEA